MQLMKAISSRWLRENVGDLCGFQWQEGYGAFSIGVAQVDATLQYIANQEQRHHKMTFEQEYRAVLERHAIAWLPDEALG
jgi:putative transposase